MSAGQERLKDRWSMGGVEGTHSVTCQTVMPYLPSFFDESQVHL